MSLVSCSIRSQIFHIAILAFVLTAPVWADVVFFSTGGGEGEWNPGAQIIKPGLFFAGKNPVCLDAVCMSVMGYDPQAERGTKPFVRGDNSLRLAETVGIGTTDLSRIDGRGLRVGEALHDYGSGPVVRLSKAS